MDSLEVMKKKRRQQAVAFSSFTFLLAPELASELQSFSPAVDRDGPVLSKLLLGFMHLADEVDEALAGFGHALLRPVGELELPHCSGLAILEKQQEGGR